MRINLLGSFAAGVFIATSITGIVYLSSDHNDAKATENKVGNHSKTTVLPSEEEMKSKLETKGYVVQTKAEYDKNMADAKAADQKNATSDNNNQKVVYRTTVKVSKGMTSYDVGKQLLKAKLIKKSAFQFSKDIERKKLENRLRPGSYTVDSGMSYDKIIATIFKK
ncbi:endolytic transglycosylase MltG [Bacillus sp. FJAT-49736]|uniref:endolytic transglycosylase MltG n=1 Tax=Bacillus sp. FJAT-49736 TaxID=2833582 RepID=UPI001BC9A7E1|nr:endolytic transglycosylase MltG [Bacillus sp. FJAT-49736]MBS4173027.1 endolytic transglycosylase MltG [Bacillus sp. FJAT-49736]